MEGQLVDHDAESDRAGPARQRRQVHAGGTKIADRGGLMFDGEIILIAEPLGFLGGANMLVVDVGRHWSGCHRCLCEDVVETEFELPHGFPPPCLPERSATRPPARARPVRSPVDLTTSTCEMVTPHGRICPHYGSWLTPGRCHRGSPPTSHGRDGSPSGPAPSRRRREC